MWRDRGLVANTEKINERATKLPSYLNTLSEVTKSTNALLLHCREVALQYGRALLEQKRRTLWDQVGACCEEGPGLGTGMPRLT